MKQRVFFKTSIPEDKRKIIDIANPELEVQMSLEAIIDNLQKQCGRGLLLEDFPIVVLNDNIIYDVSGRKTSKEIKKEIGEYFKKYRETSEWEYSPFAGRIMDRYWNIDEDEDEFEDVDILSRLADELDELDDYPDRQYYPNNRLHGGRGEKDKFRDKIKDILGQEIVETIRTGDYDYNSNTINIYYNAIIEHFKDQFKIKPRPGVLYFLHQIPNPAAEDILAEIQVALANTLFRAVQSKYNKEAYDGTISSKKIVLNQALAEFYSVIYAISMDDKHYEYLKGSLNAIAKRRYYIWKQYRYSSWATAKAWFFMVNIKGAQPFSNVVGEYKNFGTLYKYQYVYQMMKSKILATYKALLDSHFDAPPMGAIPNVSARNGKLIPVLPNMSLAPGEYVKSAMLNLSRSGYVFSISEINDMCSTEWARLKFNSSFPFMRVTDGINIDTKIDGYQRFWSDVFVYGGNKVLITNLWYDNQAFKRSDFINWYKSLK